MVGEWKNACANRRKEERKKRKSKSSSSDNLSAGRSPESRNEAEEDSIYAERIKGQSSHTPRLRCRYTSTDIGNKVYPITYASMQVYR